MRTTYPILNRGIVRIGFGGFPGGIPDVSFEPPKFEPVGPIRIPAPEAAAAPAPAPAPAPAAPAPPAPAPIPVMPVQPTYLFSATQQQPVEQAPEPGPTAVPASAQQSEGLGTVGWIAIAAVGLVVVGGVIAGASR